MSEEIGIVTFEFCQNPACENKAVKDVSFGDPNAGMVFGSVASYCASCLEMYNLGKGHIQIELKKLLESIIAWFEGDGKMDKITVCDLSDIIKSYLIEIG